MIKIKKRYICLMLSIILLYFFAYTKYYYDEINLHHILKHFIILNNKFFSSTFKTIKLLVQSLFNSNNIKVLLILIVLIYLLKKYNFLIDSIKSFQFGDIKIEKEATEKLENMKKETQDKMENTENGQGIKSKSNIIEEQKKLELINLLIDDKLMVKLLTKFINKKIGMLTVPLKLDNGDKISTRNIGKIFDYELKANSIKIKSIKPEIKDEIIQIYINLKDNCLIYVA